MSKKLFIISLIFCSLHLHIDAQRVLNVKSKSGTISSYTISTIKNLTFLSGNMTINKKDLTSNSFTIAAMRYMFFGNDMLNTTDRINDNLTTKLCLYPNPTVDVIFLRFSSKSSNNAQVEIIDLQGRIVLKETFSSQLGINSHEINVSELHHGLYLIQLQHDNIIESTKFIKN